MPALIGSPFQTRAAAAGGRGRVLVVDDDVDGGQSLCMLFELEGYEVARATGLASSDTVRSEREGFVAHLLKPVDPRKLGQLLKELLAG